MLDLHVASNELRVCVKALDLYPRAEQKQIFERLAFDCFMRKGSVPPQLITLQKLAAKAAPGFKFNPYRDELGRFTFAPGGPAGDDESDDQPDDNSGNSNELDDSADAGNSSIRLVQEIVPPDILFGRTPVTIDPPLDEFPQDPAQPPAPGYQWEGEGPPGSPQGNWVKPGTDGYLHPDMEHPLPKGPHWDYEAPDGSEWRWYPDGRMEPKIIAGGEIT